MNQNVMVINPYVADFKLYDEWMHPLGLYSLVSLLENSGYPVRYFDCLGRDRSHAAGKFSTSRFQYREIAKPPLYREIPRKYKLYGKNEDEFRAFLSGSDKPALICVGSMMTYWLPGVVETVRIIRSIHPDTPIVLGGVATRLIPAIIKKQIPGIALAAPGTNSGHNAIPDILQRIKPQQDISLMSGLQKIENARHGPILLTLGCPLACSYCASSILQGAFKIRDLKTVVNEVLFLAENRDVADFAFYDDALLYQSHLGLFPLLEALGRSGRPLRFHAPNGLHLSHINELIATTIKSAGFKTLRFGYESGSASYRGDTSRKTDRQELIKKTKILKQVGFAKKEIGVYVMAGLEGQTPGQVLEEMDFVASQEVKVKPVFLSPVPGTRLFAKYAARYPQITSDPLWHNDTFFVTQLPNWGWEAMEEVRVQAKVLNR